MAARASPASRQSNSKMSNGEKTKTLSPVLKGFAGSLGGVAEAMCLQPMDVIKTRIQLDTIGKYKGIISTGQVRQMAFTAGALL